MFWSVGEVIFTTNDMADFHRDVINDIDKMKNPRAVGTTQCHVGMSFRIGQIELNRSAD